MDKILLFSGTTEGRKLSEFLSEKCICHRVFVATEYGELVMEENEYAEICTGRLTREDQMELFAKEDCLVVDATHPYATKVSENLKEACEQTKSPYIRVLRESESYDKEPVTYCESVEEATLPVSERIRDGGKILLTTGSKELGAFTRKLTEEERHSIVARVLPSVESITLCENAGIKRANIIAMQGPFSKEMNLAMLKEYRITVMVTKESGKAGGFLEKYEAAKEAGVELIVIGRPMKEEGLSLEEAYRSLEKYIV